MIAKMGMMALLGTMGTAAMATPASAHEWNRVEPVRYESGYGYGRRYDRDGERARFERERAMRERMRWMRYRRAHGYPYGTRY